MRMFVVSLALLGSCCVLAADAPKPIVLFNGKDLTNFYTYLRDEGKNKDSKKVVTVVEEDGKPAIRVSGEVWGCFTTADEYGNYKLTCEFKWGDKTWAPREKATRDSGILIHGIGDDGAHGGVWLESIEYQLIEGGTGDFIVCGGKGNRPRITCEVEYLPTKAGKQAYYKAGGEKKEFAGGRVNWYARAPEWTDTINFRGKDDVENPVGEWNRVEIICDGDTIISKLNGKVVNAATKVTPTKGKILFQSEGAEIFFRDIVITPISK